MATGDGLGHIFNVIHEASGVNVPLTRASAVSFVSFLDAGTHTLVFTQTDSSGVNAEIDLNVFSIDPVSAEARVFAGPAVGGGWVDVSASSSANDADGADATNDCYVVTVRSEQLSDGYDQVQCTPSAGTCIAIIHNLNVQRKPANLASSLSA